MTVDPALRASTHDYLANPAVAAYFTAREHEAYYRSLKSVDERRAFHDQLKAALLDFLRLSDVSALSTLDEIIERSARVARIGVRESGDPVDRARSSEPRGVELLQVGSDPDFDELRGAYRQAALRHHPDRGGSNLDMAAINRAYELLHAMLVDRSDVEPLEFGESWAGPRTGRDYVYVTTRLLFDLALDEWALDDAAALLEEVGGNLLTQTTFDQSNELIGLIRSASKLAERLAAAGLTAEAVRALETARAGLKWSRKQGLFYDPLVDQAEKAVAEVRKPHFVLNHVRQIENAYRLGAINEKRYVANLKRVDGNSAALEADRRARRELLAEARFVESLPADAKIKRDSNSVSARLIPQPDYFQVRADSLSLEQQAEYARTFTPPYKLELIEKYAFVRLSSVLRSAIFSPGVVEPSTLVAEANQLGALGPKARYYASHIETILRYFTELEDTEQRAYAGELAQLLKPESTTIGGLTITITIGGGGGGYEFGWRFLGEAEAAGRRRTGR